MREERRSGGGREGRREGDKEGEGGGGGGGEGGGEERGEGRGKRGGKRGGKRVREREEEEKERGKEYIMILYCKFSFFSDTFLTIAEIWKEYMEWKPLFRPIFCHQFESLRAELIFPMS